MCGCLDIDGKEYESKDFDWSDKKFYCFPTPMFFHVPLKIGRDIDRAFVGARAKGYALKENGMLLQKDGLFSGKIMLELETADSNRENVCTMHHEMKVISVFTDRPWNKIYEATRRLKELVASRGGKLKAVYFWYLSCPGCIKERGYRTVVFGEH